MSRLKDPAPAVVALDDGDDSLTHVCCDCAEDVALCGADLTGLPYDERPPLEHECVVCSVLDDLPCERCGS